MDKLGENFATHTHSVFEEPTTPPSMNGGQSVPASGGDGAPPSADVPTGTAAAAPTVPAPAPEKPAEAAQGSKYRSHRLMRGGER